MWLNRRTNQIADAGFMAIRKDVRKDSDFEDILDAAARPRPGEIGKEAALRLLLNQTWELFQRLTVVLSNLHGPMSHPRGRRGLLRVLSRIGPRTVPQMARSMVVTRQHMQGLVNNLIAHGLIETFDNPDHKRSKLLRVSQEGEEFVRRMEKREAELFALLELDLGEKELVEAGKVLRTIRLSFEGQEWKNRIKEIREIEEKERKAKAKRSKRK